MFTELTALTQSTQTLFNLIKSATQLNTDNKINVAISDITSKLTATNETAMQTQEKLLRYMEKNAELEKKISQLEKWDKEKEQVELMEIARGNFAYVARSVTTDFQSSPKLCATCFEQGIKSYLQQSNEPERKRGLTCQSCSHKIIFNQYIDAV